MIPAPRSQAVLRRRSPTVVLGLFLAAGWGPGETAAQSTPEYELPPLLYSSTPDSNPVSRLPLQLRSGELKLPGAPARETVRGLLAALDMAPESQVLVFSKTSLQRKRIHPANPRAIYFSDDAYVGWVPGGLMEAAISDPRLGLAFYRIDPGSADGPIRIERDADCLSCHAGSLTRDWPGVMVRSVFPDHDGEPLTSAGSFLVGHETPFADRWGGWYVTGEHGTARHLGNGVAREQGGKVVLDRDAGANRRVLEGLFDTDNYPGAGSDVVALMVLEHQVNLHSRLVRGGLRARRWLHYQAALHQELGQPVPPEPTGSALQVIESETERIVEYLLFCEEAPLPEGGIRGDARFQAAFRRNRRADAAGRSLKDFELGTRLFQRRCSYLIYSQAFEQLPGPLKQSVFRRLRTILTAAEPPRRYAHLGATERQEIQELLRETQPELAAAWANP